ncbi:hypothetical protein [Hydrogenophaga sp. BPS33]|uniref:hypothetical protein n=1 Tax=Hydrogenophaga sp. BPS33 TaxID=2651974 RepID=UPI00131F810D|nr:hypothetical protein [Hydrogenophaga sp. BPS33]QHE88460.1 hypothetical protein F9K07_28055 [Hydrogenophaga sp. BPS33]
MAVLAGRDDAAQREELALAYEQGDIRTVGRLMGVQAANLPSGGGMGSIKNVSALPSLPKGKLPVDIAHTIGADYNPKTGKVTGGHTLLSGDVRVTQMVSAPDANGVYEAFVWVCRSPRNRVPDLWEMK